MRFATAWEEVELACVHRKMLAAEERLWRAFAKVLLRGESPLLQLKARAVV